MMGMNIKILNCTNGIHFDIVSLHAKKGGDLDWELLLKGGNQRAWRNISGVEVGVKFYYNHYDKILVADCYVK